MEEMPIAGRDEKQLFQELLGQYDGPAYIRRWRRVRDAWETVLTTCAKEREDKLKWPAILLGQLHGLAGEWNNLRPLLADEDQVGVLQSLEAELQPRLRVPVARTTSSRRLRSALAELADSLERFNAKWLAYLQGIDLGPINTLREGYNRWYVFEKECATRSPLVARQGFTPLSMLTLDDLLREMPLVQVPVLA